MGDRRGGSVKAKRTQSPYDRGLIEYGEYINDFDESALARAINTWQAARSSEPSNSALHLALSYGLDSTDQTEEALEAVRVAKELDSDRRDAEIMYLTLLAELGQEAEALSGIEAAAERQEVDLATLRLDSRRLGHLRTRGPFS
jgi:predicted Zn-dependent protease